MLRTRMPFGISTALGAVLIVAACLAAAGVPATDPWWRVAVLGGVVVGFAVAAADPVAAVAVAWAAFLLLDGFLVGRYGDLAWHGWVDVVRVGGLTAAALLGSAIGRLRVWLRRERMLAPVEFWASSSACGRTRPVPAGRFRGRAVASPQLSSRTEGHN